MADPVIPSQRGHLLWPWTADQIELVDQQFQDLFDGLRASLIGGLPGTFNLSGMTTGSLIYGTDISGTIAPLLIGSAGKMLRSTGTLPAWSTTTWPNSATTGDVLSASATNTYTNISPGTAGIALVSNGAATAPSFTTVNVNGGGTGLTTTSAGGILVGLTSSLYFTRAAGTSGSLFRMGASYPDWTTATFPNTAAAGDLLYADSLNSWSTLAKNVSATRYLSNTGAANIPAWAQVDLTNGVTGILPVANGGTATGAFTAGSVVFAGASGVYTQDNTNFFWDDSNNRLGIGTATPQTGLNVLLTNATVAIFGNGAAITSGRYTGIGLGYYEAGPLYLKSMIVQEQTGDAAARGTIHILNNNASNNTNATLSDSRLQVAADGTVTVVSDLIVNNNLVAKTRLVGSTAVGGSLTIESTSDATKGVINIANHAVPRVAVGPSPTGVGALEIRGVLNVDSDGLAAGNNVLIDADAAFEAGLIFEKDNSGKWQLYVPGSSNNFYFYSHTFSDFVLTLAGAGNVGIGTTSYPSSGTKGLVFGDGTALATMGSNTAGLYADDVAGTVNMFGIAEDGTVTRLTYGTPQTYAESNVTTDRTYDANATSLDEIADVLGTLIGDLRARGIVA